MLLIFPTCPAADSAVATPVDDAVPKLPVALPPPTSPLVFPRGGRPEKPTEETPAGRRGIMMGMSCTRPTFNKQTR